MPGREEWSRVLDPLEASVCRDPAVEFAVVYGSRMGGDPTPSSDIDIAVKFIDDLSDHERFERRCFLSGDLQQEEGPFVDLSDIERLPLDVAHDAVNGRFVCGDERAFERYSAAIEAAFSDQQEPLRRHQREVIDRIAEEGLRG